MHRLNEMKVSVNFNFRIHDVNDVLLGKLIEKIDNLVVIFYDMEVKIIANMYNFTQNNLFK